MDKIDILINEYIKLKRRLFDLRYNFLNSEQREAVYTNEGPLLILAGAGSGKTTVLVHRIAFLIRYGNAYFNDLAVKEWAESETININESEVATLKGITEFYDNALRDGEKINTDELDEILSQFIYNPCPAYNILSITFTNKAAAEMKKRLHDMLGEKAGDIWAGTFHSICVRILRRHIEKLGMNYSPNFAIYDMDDVKRQIMDIMKSLNIDEKILPARSVMTAISKYKDKLQAPKDIVKITDDSKEARILKIYEAYQNSLQRSNAVDFDDIIFLTIKLLRTNDEVREYYSGRFKYILVDEYQDTNYSQYILISLLGEKYNNVMAVGDDDQSIYRFRGATIENILNFEKRFSDAKIIKLEQNYRSTKIILDAANEIINNNTGRMGKNLWTEKNGGVKISIQEKNNQIDEANYIVDKIINLVATEKKKYRDFAVLYRVNAQAAGLELAFARNGIPCRTIGTIRFYERKEIKDMLAYLGVVSNPSDSIRLKRIINEPKRGIGDTTIAAVEKIATRKGTSMFEVINNADKYSSLGRGVNKLKYFSALMQSFAQFEKTESLPELFEKVFDDSGYRTMLEESGPEEKDRLDNVKELISQAISYTEKCAENNTDATLSGFLEEVALVSDIDNYDKSADAVTLMTIHSAKGLEFPVVFIPGMEENIFPSMQSVQAASIDGNLIEEERRLAYVAVTRAKEKLFLAYARERLLYGRSSYNSVSRFINEIPDELCERVVLEEREQRPSPSTFASSKKYPPKVPQNSEFATKYTTASTEANDKTTKNAQRYKTGDAVEHINFGTGLVIGVTDVAGDTLYEIAFDKVGTKKMMRTYTYDKLKLIK